MPFFVARLVAHRPDFPANITPDEGAIMQRHNAYLRELLAKGTLVIAGPVLDPKGVYGLGVFEAESVDAVNAILANDPAREIGRYEVAPMMSAVARPVPAG
jgi:uncharacterized protein YciI